MRERKAGNDDAPQNCADYRRLHARRQPAATFKEETADHCAGSIGAQQSTVSKICLFCAEIMSEFWHRRLKCRADKERDAAGEHNHGRSEEHTSELQSLA